MLQKFDAQATLDHMLHPDGDVNVFMAVPTIYSKLIDHIKVLTCYLIYFLNAADTRNPSWVLRLKLYTTALSEKK